MRLSYEEDRDMSEVWWNRNLLDSAVGMTLQRTCNDQRTFMNIGATEEPSGSLLSF